MNNTTKPEIRISKYETNSNYQSSNDQNNKTAAVNRNWVFCFENWYFEHLILFRISDFVLRILTEKSGFTVLSSVTVINSFINV